MELWVSTVDIESNPTVNGHSTKKILNHFILLDPG